MIHPESFYHVRHELEKQIAELERKGRQEDRMTYWQPIIEDITLHKKFIATLEKILADNDLPVNDVPKEPYEQRPDITFVPAVPCTAAEEGTDGHHDGQEGELLQSGERLHDSGGGDGANAAGEEARHDV